MKIVKIAFEYKTFPVWIYDEEGNLVANDLPDYLIGNEEIDPLFVELQQDYDSLYSDTENEFKYVGFTDSMTEKAFYNKVEYAKQILKKLLSLEYSLC